MANCKENCIHYKVCMYGDLTEYKTEQILKDDCDNYMPKDVVPKSEVDRLETEVRLLTENSILAKYPCCVSTSKGLILTKSLEEYDKLLADISSEVAREIFDILDDFMHLYELNNHPFYVATKKKYTGGNNDAN